MDTFLCCCPVNVKKLFNNQSQRDQQDAADAESKGTQEVEAENFNAIQMQDLSGGTNSEPLPSPNNGTNEQVGRGKHDHGFHNQNSDSQQKRRQNHQEEAGKGGSGSSSNREQSPCQHQEGQKRHDVGCSRDCNKGSSSRSNEHGDGEGRNTASNSTNEQQSKQNSNSSVSPGNHNHHDHQNNLHTNNPTFNHEKESLGEPERPEYQDQDDDN